MIIFLVCCRIVFIIVIIMCRVSVQHTGGKYHRHTNQEVEGRDGTFVAIHHRVESSTVLAEKWNSEVFSQRQNTTAER